MLVFLQTLVIDAKTTAAKMHWEWKKFTKFSGGLLTYWNELFCFTVTSDDLQTDAFLKFLGVYLQQNENIGSILFINKL